MKKRIWLGSRGPLIYDDTEDYPQGGYLQKAAIFEGEVLFSSPADSPTAITGVTHRVLGFDLTVSDGSTEAFLTELYPGEAMISIQAVYGNNYGEMVLRANLDNVEILHDLDNGFATIPGTTSSLNISFSTTNSQFEVENQTGAEQTLRGFAHGF